MNILIKRWREKNGKKVYWFILSMLSDIYHISINEILGSERASGAEFTRIAEQNITATLKELEKDFKTFEKKMLIIYKST